MVGNNNPINSDGLVEVSFNERLFYISKVYIYMIKNNVNGKFYIGSTTRGFERKGAHIKTLRDGVHVNAHLQNSYNKYGEDSFSFIVLEWLDVEDCLDKQTVKKMVLGREQYYIDILSPQYNFNPIATSPLGINFREKMGDERYEESRRKRKESILKSGYLERLIQYNKTRIVTQEMKEKISKSLTGRKLSPERVEKMKQPRKPHSEETKRRISIAGKKRGNKGHRKKKVVAKSDREDLFFESLAEAARYFKANSGTIYNAVKYKTSLRGYKWSYAA